MTDANPHVAFFRNMNLGQARSHSPTRPVLEDAFALAGAVGVRSFQTNGTVLFDSLTVTPAAVVEQVRARIGSKATTRGFGTIERLLRAAGLGDGPTVGPR